jgi:preprotein translocase subunit SecF
MFKVIENRRWYFLASGILVALSIAALVVSAISSGLPLVLDTETTDPQTIQAAGLAALVTIIAVPALAWWLFRDAPNALRSSANLAMMIAHNVLVVFGFYALMGMVAGWQADTMLFVAVLVVIGLSIQDVIPLLSRIREDVRTHRSEIYVIAVNRSILEQFNPTLTVRLCATLILVALLLVGGPVILPLAATLLVGLLCETYSSALIAPLLLTL